MSRNRCNLSDIFTGLLSGGTKTLDVYLQHGGSVSVTNVSGEGLLAAAIKCGDSSVFHFCLEKGADVRHRDKFQRTPLHVAAEYDDVPAMECLLRRGADICATDENGATPLLVAAQRKRSTSVEFLLSNGADVNVADAENGTALLAAVETGDVSLVSLILSYSPNLTDASTRLPNPAGKTSWTAEKAPLVQALKEKRYEIASEIFNHNNTRKIRENFVRELHWAVKHGHYVAAEMLIKHGVGNDSEPFLWHSITRSIVLQNSVNLMHLLVQHHPHATWPDAQDNRLLSCVAGAYKILPVPMVFPKHTYVHCRLLAVLLHCGMSISGVHEAISQGKLDKCECRALIQPLLTGTLQPAPLKVTCRTAIRHTLGPGLSHKISFLGLPKPLKRYLMFESEGIRNILSPLVSMDVNVWG